MRSLFLRGLGLVYFVAFRSLRRQLLGLFGRQGISSIATTLRQIERSTGRRPYELAPTLFWRGASDRALVDAARAGEIAATLLALDVAPVLSALACGALYLSFVAADGELLGYQWDALLLETTAHALAVAPWTRGERDEEPPWHALWLLRALAFRFHFEAGLAKVRSHDETWRERTALRYHYETQPLPTRLGWWAHHLPPGWNAFATRIVLAVELFSPVLGLAPRPLRLAAFWSQALVQAGIFATGNFGFFNPLALLLSLWHLDDDALPFRSRRRVRPRGWTSHLRVALELPLLALGALELYGRLRPLPRWGRRLLRRTQPFSVPSSYGLFAVMTTTRPEIVIEGSDDGREWREYVPRHKPGPLHRPPRQVAPHQPRLDWQLWFAAMQPPPAWFVSLLVRLLEGATEVEKLFARVPFDHPPRYVRALLYHYEFTDLATRRSTGEYWKRQLLRSYVPALRLAGSAARPDGKRPGMPPGGP